MFSETNERILKTKKLSIMKTSSILESIEIINYWIVSVGLTAKSESYFNNWGLSENGDLLSELKMWALDYISEN